MGGLIPPPLGRSRNSGSLVELGLKLVECQESYKCNCTLKSAKFQPILIIFSIANPEAEIMNIF